MLLPRVGPVAREASDRSRATFLDLEDFRARHLPGTWVGSSREGSRSTGPPRSFPPERRDREERSRCIYASRSAGWSSWVWRTEGECESCKVGDDGARARGCEENGLTHPRRICCYVAYCPTVQKPGSSRQHIRCNACATDWCILLLNTQGAEERILRKSAAITRGAKL